MDKPTLKMLILDYLKREEAFQRLSHDDQNKVEKIICEEIDKTRFCFSCLTPGFLHKLRERISEEVVKKPE